MAHPVVEHQPPDELPGSGNGAAAAPVRELTTLTLAAGWDAALTYRAIEAPDPDRDDRVVFVGRDDLLGALENAISDPDLRGTFLISGYRGAGKTTLVIEAARRAAPRLDKQGRELLPLVLNVSEVSASLSDATSSTTPTLGIDARRLLTALLRKLRGARSDRLSTPEGKKLLARVADVSEKAEAARWEQTSQRQSRWSRVERVTSTRSVRVANLLKAVAVVAALPVIALEAVALHAAAVAIHVAALALAGLAVVSYASSRAVSREAAASAASDTQAQFDNSLHQIESDLKDILADLEANGLRTIFVLEELDKVDDVAGKQLDAVIRYFKNLFTQAPALFFFLTDKAYFELISKKIADGRRLGTYAVEHTFFTHRLFVSRPGLEECLDYFDAVLMDSEAKTAVADIRTTVDARVRPLDDMSLVERFLRVLLFASQNHLFDLKNEMRRYVHVTAAGSQLRFDAASFPQQEQAVAALHFAQEQKAQIYRFRGGGDYANEVLRNCLSRIFEGLGTDTVYRAEDLYPALAGEGARLRVAERRSIREAVDSLLEDLDRGGALETVVDAKADAPPGYRWSERAASVFNQRPKFEDHEKELWAQLKRAIRICEQFADSGPLGGLDTVDSGLADRLKQRYEAEKEELRQAETPPSKEDAQHRSGTIEHDLVPLLEAARARHRDRLATLGWRLTGTGGRGEETVWGVSGDQQPDEPASLLLIYGGEAQAPSDQVLTQVGRPVAVVLVSDDPEGAEAALQRWREPIGMADAYISAIPLAEGVSRAAVDERWGEATGDEFILARVWRALRISVDEAEPEPGPGSGEVVLRGSDGEERNWPTYAAAIRAWLDGPDRALGIPEDAVPHIEAVGRALLDLSVLGPRVPVVPTDEDHDLAAAATSGGSPETIRARLVARGRLILIYEPTPGASLNRESSEWRGEPAVLVGSSMPRGFPQIGLSTLRVPNDPAATRALARFIATHDEQDAAALLERAAGEGDMEAVGDLVVRLQRTGSHDEARSWAERLAARGDWPHVLRVAEAIRDSEIAAYLLSRAAEAGDADAIVTLIERSTDEAEQQPWIRRLIDTGDDTALLRAADALSQGARELVDGHPAVSLYVAAARRGNLKAASVLVIHAAAIPDAEGFEEQLIRGDDSAELFNVARLLDEREDPRAVRFHRAAANAGHPDSMLELLVRLAASDREASQDYQELLVKRGDWTRLRTAADRLRSTAPERATAIDKILRSKTT